MSHLYKEWNDLVREYSAQQSKPSWHDKLTEERKQLNKEYALNNQVTARAVKENDNDK